jgi:hypothetical protein
MQFNSSTLVKLHAILIACLFLAAFGISDYHRKKTQVVPGIKYGVFQ